MVSALWKACSNGDLVTVNELLKEASTEDIEIKDPSGVTPLIEAVKNNHADVVRALLEKGADPANACSQGRPDMFASEPAIMELLSAAANRSASDYGNGLPNGASLLSHAQPPQGYPQPYMIPPNGYSYYPPAGPHVIQEGSYYMGPPPPHVQHSNNLPWGGGPGNIHTVDTARVIPCRYFPDCRFGASCMFAHPQASPPVVYHTSSPMSPQGIYPGAPFEPSYASHAYYSMIPPSFIPQSSGTPHIIPVPPAGSTPSADTPSGPFTPNGSNHLGSFGSSIPMSPPYNNTTAPPASAPHTMFMNGGPIPIMNGHKPSVASESYNGSEVRENLTHIRRSSTKSNRGTSTVRNKPPCAFFPLGKCKNGDDCLYPHVMREGPVPTHHPFSAYARGGVPRRGGVVNGHSTRSLEDKMASMNINRPNSSFNGPQYRAPFSKGPYRSNDFNGYRQSDRRAHTVPKQALPSPDDFPVLNGSVVTTPLRSPGINNMESSSISNGPTAAQVLQAPPPVRQDSFREATTMTAQSSANTDTDNANHVAESEIQDSILAKPVSFAAVANGITGTSHHEVSVAA